MLFSAVRTNHFGAQDVDGKPRFLYDFIELAAYVCYIARPSNVPHESTDLLCSYIHECAVTDPLLETQEDAAHEVLKAASAAVLNLTKKTVVTKDPKDVKRFEYILDRCLHTIIALNSQRDDGYFTNMINLTIETFAAWRARCVAWGICGVAPPCVLSAPPLYVLYHMYSPAIQPDGRLCVAVPPIRLNGPVVLYGVSECACAHLPLVSGCAALLVGGYVSMCTLPVPLLTVHTASIATPHEGWPPFAIDKANRLTSPRAKANLRDSTERAQEPPICTTSVLQLPHVDYGHGGTIYVNKLTNRADVAADDGHIGYIGISYTNYTDLGIGPF